MVEIRWHSQTKGRDHSEHKLRPTPARQSSTLPARAWGATPLGYSPTAALSPQERTFAREEADGRVGTAAQPGIPRSLAGRLRGLRCAGPRCYLPSPGRREDSGAGVVYYTFTVMDLHQL